MKLITLILPVLLSIISYGQTSYPKGVYYDTDALLSKVPNQNPELQIVPIILKEWQEKETYNYGVLPLNKSIKLSHINRKVSLISDGEILLINGKHLGLGPGYLRVLQEGENLIFKGHYGNQEAMMTGAVMGGIAGAIIADAVSSDERKVYYYNPTERAVVRVTKNHLKYLLEPYGTLYISYQNELDQKSANVILKHVLKWNQKVTTEKLH